MAKKPQGGKTGGKTGGKASAGKSGSGGKSPRSRKKAEPRDIETRVVDAAMDLAAERGWRDLSYAEILEAAGVSLADAYPVIHSKAGILRALNRRIDREVLDTVSPDDFSEDETARDRLFDIVMRRFDALQPYREALGEIYYDQIRDPLSAVCAVPRLDWSMTWMLEAAGLSSSGPRGALRRRGLAAIYLATMRTWLRDDSADLSKTMAALDGYLRRIEPIARAVEGAGRRRRDGEPPEDEGDIAGEAGRA